MTWFLEWLGPWWLEIFYKYNLEPQFFNASGIWNTVRIYSEISWLGLNVICGTRFYLNKTGIQLTLDLGKNFIESKWLLFCDVLYWPMGDNWLCIRERNNVINSLQQLLTLLKVWFHWLIILLFDCDCVL